MAGLPNISDAEWEVMNVVWDDGPLGAAEVAERLATSTDWTEATVKTLLGRLVKKGALTYEIDGRRYLYRALGLTVRDRLVERWGGDARWELDSETHPAEATYLALDCSKAHQRLGWCPALPLERAVEWLVDWYRDHHEGGDARELTLRRIADYEEFACKP